MSDMLWASHLSLKEDLAKAVEECGRAVAAQLGTEPPDVAMVFASASYGRELDNLPFHLRKVLPAKRWIGCSAAGVIGAGHEAEHCPAVSVTAAWLPDVEVKTFAFQENIPDLDSSPKTWHKALGLEPDGVPGFVVLADPFSRDLEKFLSGLDYAYPKTAKIGGLASGAQKPGGSWLYKDGEVLHSGFVGVSFSGSLVIDTIVAQGCRPIGTPGVVSACEGNILMGLDDKSPLDVLQQIAQGLEERDRSLMSHSLFLGIAQNAMKKDLNQGDFLIRNITGVDPEQGMLYVGENLRQGQTVQFHLRDSRTSSDDLNWNLHRYTNRRQDGAQAQGALLFSCLGRGRYLYGRPDHDTSLFLSKLGPVPMGGFFCNGEIGPVGPTTYLHGYTSCFGIFRKP